MAQADPTQQEEQQADGAEVRAHKQAQLAQLKQQHAAYAEWVASFVRTGAGLGGSSTDHGAGAAPLPALSAEQLADLQQHAGRDIPALCASVHLGAAAKAYLAALKAWAEHVRELERRCRDFSAIPAPGPAPPTEAAPAGAAAAGPLLEAYSQAAYYAIEGLSATMYAADLAAYYAPSAEHAAPSLPAVAAAIGGRMHECRHTLRTRLAEDLLCVLEAVGWPPPLAPTGDATGGGGAPPSSTGAGGTGGAGGAGAPEDDEEGRGAADAARRASGAGASTTSFGAEGGARGQGSRAFKGFAADPARLAQLHVLDTCLTCMQQAVQTSAFKKLRGDSGAAEGSTEEPQSLQEEGPLLWAASAGLVPALQARLQAHFAPTSAAGRLDKPEWLLQTVIRLVQENVAHVAALQPGLDAAGLGGHCHMGVEFARAMREATKVVLRTARLPALQDAWERGMEGAGELWRAQVQEAIAFELKLAPFLGVPQGALESGVLPEPLLSASVLRAITDDQEAMACWVAAEREEAQARLLAALEEARAWQPLLEDEDEASADGTKHEEGGWQREFNAPRVAEVLVELVGDLVLSSRNAPTSEAQKALLDGVGGSLLSLMMERMTEMLGQAAALGSILSEAGAPRVGACVAAARFLHHTLSELLEGPSLSRLQQTGGGAENGASPTATLTASCAATSATGASLSTLSPVKGALGDVVVRHSFAPTPLKPPVLAAGVAAMGSLHREWGLRIAQELALIFGRAAAGYKEAVETTDEYPTHTGAAGTVTPILAPAMALLQAGLYALAPSLDGPSFRDIWRAVAVPVNRFLFNYVATEAFFSAAGAHQFAVDCAGMVAVFSPFTKRPAAHFREMLAAARLLTLEDETAGEVVRTASAQEVAGEPLWRNQWLADLGVGCLSAQQCVAVIERRLG